MERYDFTPFVMLYGITVTCDESGLSLPVIYGGMFDPHDNCPLVATRDGLFWKVASFSDDFDFASGRRFAFLGSQPLIESLCERWEGTTFLKSFVTGAYKKFYHMGNPVSGMTLGQQVSVHCSYRLRASLLQSFGPRDTVVDLAD